MRVEMHCHSFYSDGSMSVERAFRVARAKGLGGLIIADHNTISHQKKAAEAARKFGMLTVPAVEITAFISGRKGHVLAYFLEEMPHSKELHDVLDFIRESGGIAVAAHPFGDHSGIGFVEGFDAAELNSSILCWQNRKAVVEAIANGIPLTAGSDAHNISEIGRAVVEFEGDSGEELFNQIRKGKALLGFRCLSIDFLFYKARRLGWRLLKGFNSISPKRIHENYHSSFSRGRRLQGP